MGDGEPNIGLRRPRDPQGRPVAQTNGEFSLLIALLSAPRRTLSRDQLPEPSGLHNAEVHDRSIDVPGTAGRWFASRRKPPAGRCPFGFGVRAGALTYWC